MKWQEYLGESEKVQALFEYKGISHKVIGSTNKRNFYYKKRRTEEKYVSSQKAISLLEYGEWKVPWYVWLVLIIDFVSSLWNLILKGSIFNIISFIPVAIFLGMGESRASRHLYQTIYEYEGSCEGKSELLAFLLKEIGFDVVLFYYQEENHEAVGIRCPVKYSLNESGYCFVETTLAGPISYSEGRYLGPGGSTKLGPYTEIINVSGGISLGDSLDDYKDATNSLPNTIHIEAKEKSTGQVYHINVGNINI